MENTPEIRTSRLLLRRFTPEDAEAFYQIMSDKEVNTFLPWFPMQSLEAVSYTHLMIRLVLRLHPSCRCRPDHWVR